MSELTLSTNQIITKSIPNYNLAQIIKQFNYNLNNDAFNFLSNIWFVLSFLKNQCNMNLSTRDFKPFKIKYNCNYKCDNCLTIEEHHNLIDEFKYLFIFNDLMVQYINIFYESLLQLKNISDEDYLNEEKLYQYISNYNNSLCNFKSMIKTKNSSIEDISKKCDLLESFNFLNFENKNIKKIISKEKSNILNITNDILLNEINYDGNKFTNEFNILFKLNNNYFFGFNNIEELFIMLKYYINNATIEQLYIVKSKEKPSNEFIGQCVLHDLSNKVYYIFSINLNLKHIDSLCEISSNSFLIRKMLCLNEYEEKIMKEYIFCPYLPKIFSMMLCGKYHILILKKIKMLVNCKYNDENFIFKVIDCDNFECNNYQIIIKPNKSDKPIKITCLSCNNSNICSICNKKHHDLKKCKSNFIDYSIKRYIIDYHTKKYIKNNTISCPSCTMHFENIYNCNNNIICNYCNTNFECINVINQEMSKEIKINEIILFILNVIILILLKVIYIITTIMALIKWINEYQIELCPKSNLYPYGVFTSICACIYICYITLNYKYINNINFNNKDYIFFLTSLLFFNIAFIIWGFFEFVNVDCASNLNNTFLYKCTFTYFISLMIISIFIIIRIIYIKLSPPLLPVNI